MMVGRNQTHDSIVEAQMASIQDSLKDMTSEIKNLAGKITSLAIDQAAQIERRCVNEASIKKIEHTVYGNGKDGLMTRVDRIEQRHTKYLWVITLVASAAATICAALLPLLLKFLASL